MKYTIKAGTYFGIPVRIHFTFPAILVAFAIEGWLSGGWAGALWALALVISVFVCVVLHEFGHSLQVQRYGIRVRDIILFPIGGMARAERIPERPSQEIIVAISGPIVNFIIAALLFGILLLVRGPMRDVREFLFTLLTINLVLGIFNLIPAFPMDGGRILRGALATRMPYVRATRYAKDVGQLIALAFAIIGFVHPQFIMLPVIGAFVFFGAIGEERMVRVRHGLGDLTLADLVDGHLPLLRSSSDVARALEVIAGSDAALLPVTDDEGELAAVVEREALLRAAPGAVVGDVASTDLPVLDGTTPAVQGYYLLRSRKWPVVGVIDAEGFAGVVLFEDLQRGTS